MAVVPGDNFASAHAPERDDDGGTGLRYVHPDSEALRREYLGKGPTAANQG